MVAANTDTKNEEPYQEVHQEAEPYLLGLLPDLNEKFGPALVDERTGVFEVDTIQVKIGKSVHKWRLGSQ